MHFENRREATIKVVSTGSAEMFRSQPAKTRKPVCSALVVAAD